MTATIHVRHFSIISTGFQEDDHETVFVQQQFPFLIYVLVAATLFLALTLYSLTN